MKPTAALPTATTTTDLMTKTAGLLIVFPMLNLVLLEDVKICLSVVPIFKNRPPPPVNAVMA